MASRLSIFTLALVLLGGTMAAAAQPVRATLKPEPDIVAEPAPKSAVTDQKAKAGKDARPAKAAPKRRAVLQQIEPVRPIGSAAPEPYRPTGGRPGAPAARLRVAVGHPRAAAHDRSGAAQLRRRRLYRHERHALPGRRRHHPA
jgi:hypothetical protein